MSQANQWSLKAGGHKSVIYLDTNIYASFKCEC